MKRERAQLQVDQQGVSTDALLKTMPGTPNWLKAKPATQSPFSVLNQKQVQNDNPFAGTGAVSEIFHESETLASPQLKENNAPNYQSPQKSVKSLSFASPASSLFKKAENLVQKRAHRTPFRLALDSENTPQRNRMMATSTPNFDDEWTRNISGYVVFQPIKRFKKIESFWLFRYLVVKNHMWKGESTQIEYIRGADQ